MNYLPYWMTQAQQSGMFSPNTPYLGAQSTYQDPMFQGAMPNIYADASNPFDQSATPLSGGVSGSITPQVLQGLAALSSVMQKKGSQQPALPPAPQAQTFNGAMFTPKF